MDQAVIVESIGNHLDQLEKYVNAVMVLAAVVAWAGINRRDAVEALGVKVARRHAFVAMAVIYLIANVAILTLFLRIAALFRLLDVEHVGSGFTLLATHAWVLNPFACFGSGSLGDAHAYEGQGLLLVVWWLCTTSLTLLVDRKTMLGAILMWTFMLCGLCTMWAIEQGLRGVIAQMEHVSPDIAMVLRDASFVRSIGNLIGMLVGFLLFIAADKLQAEQRKLSAP